MASKDLKYNLKVDAKDAQKALRDTGDDADDTRTKAQKLAEALGKLADDADAEFADMRSASDAMATALGEDFVKARTEAGGSVDGIVAGLKDMGLSFDDIRADADQLADAVKRLDTVRANVDSLGSSAKTASGDFDRVRDSADNSRSVLANMVGNSTQDIAGLGGVAGTAGMALGQLGEYATEGNISLSGLAKVAGPMAALTAGSLALSWAIKAAGAEAKEAKRETEFYVKQLDLLADKKYEEAAEALATEWADTIPILKDYGFGVEDLVAALSGESEMLDELKGKRQANNDIIKAANGVWTEAASAAQNENLELDKVIENLEEGRDARDNAITTTREHKRVVDEFSTALGGEKAALKDTEEHLRTFSDAAILAKDATDKAEEATRKLDEAYSDFIGSLDQEDAFASFQTAMYNYRSEVEHSDQSTRDYKRALADVTMAMENIPPEVKTQMIATLDQGNIDAIESRLNFTARDRQVQINGILVGSDLRKAMEGRTFHDGGVVPGPPGSEQLILAQAGETVTPAGKGGGGGPVNITINALTGNAADIERAVVTALKRHRQRGGVV